MVLSSDFKFVIALILIYGLLSSLNNSSPVKNTGAVTKSSSSVSKKTISKFSAGSLSSLDSLETYGGHKKNEKTSKSSKSNKVTKSTTTTTSASKTSKPKKAVTPKVAKKVQKVAKKAVKKAAKKATKKTTHNVSDYLPKDTAKSKKFGHTSFQHHKLPHKHLLPKIKSVNTVGNQMKYATLDLRGLGKGYINPQTVVSPWMNTTASPDLMRRPLC